MYYLISQYAWWLILALILGLIVGHITCSRTEPRSWGWLPLGLIVALAALVLTLFRFINGVPALWLETALLFFTFYLAGCCLGCLIKQTFTVPEPAMGVRNWHGNLGEPGAPIGKAELVGGGVQDWHRDMSGAAPVAVAAPPVVSPQVVSPPVVSAPVVSPVVAKPVAVMPKVEGEDQIAGARPVGLAAPRGGKADDLKLIRGIGKQNEGRLHGLGIWHFDQVAAWTKDNALWVGSYLAFPGRIEREGWVAQATQLAAGKETEFAARVKRGEVATSKDDGSLGQGNMEKIDTSKPKA